MQFIKKRECMSPSEISKSSSKTPMEGGRKELLSRKISDLKLEVPGTQLETLINELYQELESAGVSFKPKTYLADEWGCPHGVPVIGIPFYLADPGLCKLEGELTGIEAENEGEVMMCLRHEAGYAFNYAYRLFMKPEWRRQFGMFSQPYKEDYKPTPFSTKFVRHIPGWYAQKHPDEDFANSSLELINSTCGRLSMLPLSLKLIEQEYKHYMEEADKLCRRVAIMDGGKIIAMDTPHALKSQIGNPEHVTLEEVFLKLTGRSLRD
jgi:hypothetical protein